MLAASSCRSSPCGLVASQARCRPGAQAGWESQVGYRNVSVGAIGGLSAWLAFQSWVLIPRVVAVGTLGLGSVSSLVDALAADAA